MGSAFTPGGGGKGVIPRVMDTIFSRIEGMPETVMNVRVGFVEIHTVRLPHFRYQPLNLYPTLWHIQNNSNAILRSTTEASHLAILRPAMKG